VRSAVIHAISLAHWLWLGRHLTKSKRGERRNGDGSSHGQTGHTDLVAVVPMVPPRLAVSYVEGRDLLEQRTFTAHVADYTSRSFSMSWSEVSALFGRGLA
jgi:hypothetical protein